MLLEAESRFPGAIGFLLRALSEAGDAETVCRILADRLPEVVPTFCFAVLVNEPSRVMDRVAENDRGTGALSALTPLLGPRRAPLDADTISSRVARTGRPTRVADLGALPEIGEGARYVRGCGLIVAPLLAQGVTVGVLGVGVPDGRGDIPEWVELVAAHAGHAFERLRWAESDRRLRSALAKSNERLRVASRTELVGRLVGGIGHDLNNVLSVVLSYSGMLLEDTEDPAIRDDLDEIRRAGERGSALVRQMLSFGRHEVASPQTVDLASLVERMRPLLKRILFEDTELAIRVREDAGVCRADLGHVEQVILDLVLNARDSMATGGRVELEVAPVELDGRRSGPHVKLTLRSRGGAFSELVPYFSSAPGTTDLGLAVPRSLLARYSATLTMHVANDGAVVFEVLFPRIELGREGEKRVRTAALEGGTILVVDDDATVRKLARGVLGRAGYRVLDAAEGFEALAILATEEIGVLLTDIIMPRMSGNVLAERARTIRPGIVVLKMSGYPLDVARTRSPSSSPENVLSKPLAPESLLSFVETALVTRRSSQPDRGSSQLRESMAEGAPAPAFRAQKTKPVP